MSKGFIERYLKMPESVVHVIVIIIIGVNLLSPMGLPLPISQLSKDVYNMIGDLPPGSIIGFVADLDPSNYDDSYPQAAAIMNHIFGKDLKVIIVNFRAVGPMMWAKVRDAYVKIPEDKVYGVDYVNLGYIAGDEAAVAAFTNDMKGTRSNDIYGTITEELPLMKNINQGDQVDLLLMVSIGIAGTWTVRQWHISWGVPLIALVQEVGLPGAVANIESGIYDGALCGAKMGAEYEILTNHPGPGAALTDAKSIAAIIVLGMVSLGNIFEYIQKRTKKGDEEQ